MKKKDLSFYEYSRKFDDLHAKFKFWNGCSFGLVVALFLNLNDTKRYLIAFGCWLFTTIVAGIYQYKSGKVLKEMDKLVDKGE